MRKTYALFVIALLGGCAVPSRAEDMQRLVPKIIARENGETETIKSYSPLIEIYIQKYKKNPELDPKIAGDEYFLGRADLRDGIHISELADRSRQHKRYISDAIETLSMAMSFVPEGFLQQVFVDNHHFDLDHYKLDYVGKEILGEVHCLIFNVTPTTRHINGLFKGQIWVEDQDLTIVHFKGDYVQVFAFYDTYYFHFDSWRVNVAPGLWLPSSINVGEDDLAYMSFLHKRFRAQVRLWDYNHIREDSDQTLTRVMVQDGSGVKDSARRTSELSQSETPAAWRLQSAQNEIGQLEKVGLIAPVGLVEASLDAIVNNLSTSNGMRDEPPIHCRVLLTSTLETFSVGDTIVITRGLIDVLPDEASLAFELAVELAHIRLNHNTRTKYAFADQVRLSELDTYRSLIVRRNRSEEIQAIRTARDYLQKSQYQEGSTSMFIESLAQFAPRVPSLVYAHWGSRIVLDSRELRLLDLAAAKKTDKISALPLGSRTKIDPWTNRLVMLDPRRSGIASEPSDLAFAVTSTIPYLVRAVPSERN